MDLKSIFSLPVDERAAALAELGQKQDLNGLDEATREALVGELVALVGLGSGEPLARLGMGDLLGRLGDPRIKHPSEEGYYCTTNLLGGGTLEVGRFPVTVAEFRRFVAEGYNDPAWWSAAGAAWQQKSSSWKEEEATMRPEFLVDNQPVVGVSWFEAEAYAAWAGGRLPNFQERMGVVRGPGKRPYPWGEPFGHGNANTREEVLSRPCAVGLYRRDCTPDGVYDLAGNVAEWVGDEVEELRIIAPGAWSQESLSSWAKARALQSPECRASDLGFRIARG